MASCTQIDQLLQPYLDGELTHSERVILEQHVGDCPACRKTLRDHQRSNAILFEAHASARLQRDLTDYVLSHLPEMEHTPVDVAGLNRRAKHPSLLRDRVFRLMPIAAAVLLVFLAAVINKNWPDPAIGDDSIGLVGFAEGKVSRIGGQDGDRQKADVRTAAVAGDRFETGADGRMMMLLVGPSEIRMAPNTRIVVESDRRLSVEKGRVNLDIAKNQRLFKVHTPSGEITVFGTRFDVTVSAERTTVVVEEGEVQLSDSSDQHLFSVLKANQRGYVQNGARRIPVARTVAADHTQWARAIEADPETRSYFEARVQSQYRIAEISGESGYIVDTNGKPLKSIVLRWARTSPFVEYCDYEVYVYDHRNEAVFSTRIDGETFSDPRLSQVEIENTGAPRNLNAVVVKVVPVPDPSRQEVEFTDLKALIIESGM